MSPASDVLVCVDSRVDETPLREAWSPGIQHLSHNAPGTSRVIQLSSNR